MLTIKPLTEIFGAEVRGLDLRQPQSAETLDEIYDAFLDHGVIVLPGQALNIEQQLDFAQTFGDLWLLPEWSKNGKRLNTRAIDDVSNLNVTGEIADINSEKLMFQLGNQLWHSDLSHLAVPAQATMLLALEIAPIGGETEFADLRAAWDVLPQARKAALDGLIAEHSFAHSRVKGGFTHLDVDKINAAMPPVQHPVVRTHPETGRKNLYVGAHTARIPDLPPAESTELIDELMAFSTRDEFVYRHRWAVHDLIIYDNRRLLHRGRPYDMANVRRVMHRATIAGEGPTVIDGKIVPPVIGRRGPRLKAAA